MTPRWLHILFFLLNIYGQGYQKIGWNHPQKCKPIHILQYIQILLLQNQYYIFLVYNFYKLLKLLLRQRMLPYLHTCLFYKTAPCILCRPPSSNSLFHTTEAKIFLVPFLPTPHESPHRSTIHLSQHVHPERWFLNNLHLFYPEPILFCHQTPYTYWLWLHFLSLPFLIPPIFTLQSHYQNTVPENESAP